MARIVVAGGSLPGVAAAARLARAGHEVTLVEAENRIGGRLARPGVWAPVIDFPAPLRDLFRKSGRPFDAELGRRGLRLAPAPPAVHRFADGTELPWPTDRAEQWHLLCDRYSPAVAARWRDTLDALDETWQRLRPLGLEADPGGRPRHLRRALARAGLDPRDTVEHLARRLDHPHLSELVRDTARLTGSDPRETPAFWASRLSVQRTFGRWQLVDAAGVPLPATALLDALEQRLATRGVRVLTSTNVTAIRPDGVATDSGDLPADAVVSALDPWLQRRLTKAAPPPPWARLEAAHAPHITVTDDDGPPEPAEKVDHTPAGPIVTYRRPDAHGTEVVVHDHTRTTPDPGAGVRWHGARTWTHLPGVRTRNPRLFTASTSGRAGNEPWAQLLTGALAAYAAHAELTGEDIRPSNRDYRP